jgi:hypothetical protein
MKRDGILALRGELSTVKKKKSGRRDCGPIAKLKRIVLYAALLAAFGAARAGASSHFTETSFYTPGSCIVTP